MEDSILTTIKQMLGILMEDTAFDAELISHINSAISDLTHVAVGADEGFAITGYNEVWTDLTDSVPMIGQAKKYIHATVRLLFDPPTNSFLCDALTKTKEESYWRIYMLADDRKEES